MCLAIPGQIVEIRTGDDEAAMGLVSFGGLTKEVSLAFVPGAAVGTYVLVHAGFAISVIDEEEAQATLDLLRQISELSGVPMDDSVKGGASTERAG